MKLTRSAIAFYSSTIFVQGGSTIEQALFASLGFGKFANIFPSPKLTSQDFLTLFSLGELIIASTTDLQASCVYHRHFW
jgi:hypothetical protein